MCVGGVRGRGRRRAGVEGGLGAQKGIILPVYLLLNHRAPKARGKFFEAFGWPLNKTPPLGLRSLV